MRQLPIGPEEAFLLSRIDGFTPKRDLAALTGFAPERLEQMLGRLQQLGAITYGVEPSPTASPAQPASSGSQIIAATLRGSAREHTPASSEVVPSSEGASGTESQLGEEEREQIEALCQRLSQISYYELLGVEVGADRKELRHAYHARAPKYHPDRFFGQDLGAFRVKLEGVFAKLTLAYETLSDRERRAEYDAYLRAQTETAALETLLATPAPPRGSTTRPAATSTLTRPPPSAPSVPPRSDEDQRARRLALARKLSGTRSIPAGAIPSVPPSAAARSMPPAAGTPASEPAHTSVEAIAALDDLRRRREEGYLRQGDYEARTGNWSDAARSYERAASGMLQEATVQHKAARAMLNAGIAPQRTLEYAERAVLLDPTRIDHRLTLAEVYEATGQKRLAFRELEAARALQPQDDRIRSIALRLK